ncbi:MAG: ATP-binding cassette domain-containing protein [Bacteroides sp.]|nr:ATP-binding cassette domain-containing protein [Bacteroides sp.]
MSDAAVLAENVSLSIDSDSRRKVGLMGYWARLFRKKTSFEDFQVLEDISFKIKKGGSLAVVGVEGAGKTTLLKLAAGIIAPTRGKILTRGTVGAVFSEDKCFDASLSAVKNIYVIGSLMGFEREYMKKRIDRILEFAGLEEYRSVPLKKFSHEMGLRLAFSTAAHVRTDVLILDDALSAVDAGFRAKCEERIAKMKEAGTAVLSVSYLSDHILKICEQALWIDNGELMMYDTAEKVCEAYKEFTKNLN